MYLSIIVPIYNEELIINYNINKIFNCFKNFFKFEIIAINDGSNDNSLKELNNLNLENLKIINSNINRGKGYSIIKGIKESKGEVVLITDADLSSPINEFFKLHEKFDKGFDFVIGSRAKKESVVNVKQNLLRIIMGESFNFFVKFFLKLDYNDTQCGLKLFNGKKIRDLSKFCKVNRFCIDVEILYLAKKFNFSVCELGIIWNNDSRSSVNLLSDPLSMFIDLIMIRFRNYKLK